MYIYTCVSVCVHKYIRAHLHTFMHTRACIYIHTYKCAASASDVLAVKIIDFGLARELSSTSLLTGENVVGTPMYFAPEQTISGADISTLTDIWAVGVLIFHSITGTRTHKHTHNTQLPVHTQKHTQIHTTRTHHTCVAHFF